MTGRNTERELNEEKEARRQRDAYIWKWICRILVVSMVIFWLYKGLEPGWRWLALVSILLGVNEFVSPKISKDDKDGSFSISFGQDKRDSKKEDHGGAESPPISSDRTSLGFVGAVG